MIPPETDPDALQRFKDDMAAERTLFSERHRHFCRVYLEEAGESVPADEALRRYFAVHSACIDMGAMMLVANAHLGDMDYARALDGIRVHIQALLRAFERHWKEWPVSGGEEGAAND